MVLEDFFTLTEMKDGLTTLARVEELVAVMQTSDCIMKNTGDTARQWLTVATVLAATGNKHCLSHFIQSDGLRFLNQWLQVAQKCNNDPSDSFVEESISALLGALEKIPINSERLAATGIRETIKDLLAHKSFEVQEKARSLCDSWNEVEDKDPICQVVSEGGARLDGNGDGNSDSDDDPKSSNDMEITIGDGCSKSPKSPVHDESPIKETAGGTVLEHLEAAKCSDDSQLENIKDVCTSNQDASLTSLNQADENGHQGDTNSLGCSLMSNSCQESSTITKKSSLHPVEVSTSGGTSNSLIPGERNIDDKSSDFSELKDANVDDRSFEDNKGTEIEMTTKEKYPCKYNEKEIGATHSKLDQLDAVSPCPANDQGSLTENGESHDIDANERDSHTKKNASVGLVEDHSVMELEMNNGTVDCQMSNYSSTTESKPVVQHCKSDANFLQDSTNTGFMSRKPEDPGASFLRKEDFSKERACKSVLKRSKGEDSVIACFKRTMDDAKEKNSEIELDYGLDDALEVARRVAKEVEQEVVDYREPLFSSSSEKNVEGETMLPSSPDSVKGEHNESIMEKPIEDKMLMEQDLCDVGLSPNAKRLQISKDSDTEREYGRNYLESPKSVEVAQETDNNNDKSICCFDLNEDVCSDEVECSVTVNQPIFVSAPIPVAAASKGAPTLHTIPLHFGGELGWKGSAATSAFHTPSPRRTPDPEKISLVDGSSIGSKQRKNLIDLNLAEGEDDSVIDVASSAKHVPVSSGFHSGDSSVEVSSRRAEKLNLDLNCVEENEEDAFTFSSPDRKAKGQLYDHQNSKPGPSPASSSSSRQAPMRDFDLNDNPSFFDAYGSHSHQFNSDKAPCQTKAYNSFKLDGPVISILGSKIDLGQKESVNQKGSDPTNAASLARASDGSGAQPLLNFAPIPFPTFGYNSQTVGPAMPPFHPQFYGAQGSGSYMVDSRGSSSVVPQGSASFARPFFVNVMDVPSASSGAGSSHSGHDLNSGPTWAAADGRGAGTGTFGQLFGHGSGSLMEEQMKSSGAGVSLKRKEPDYPWELNMVSYKPGAFWR